MNPLYAILGFWTGLVFLVLAYLCRKKRSSKLFLQTALAAFFIAFLLFMWWAVLRAMGIIA
ncbi:MAG: hypothetical protein RR444_07705 [Oscillospiraceae bacterium]